MKSIKLALLGFVSRKKLTLIILIQLTAVLCVLNILIASLNNRRMLLEPYEGIADQKGFYFNDALGEFENSDDDLPYKLDGDVVEIEDDDFGIFYIDASDNPDKYVGKTVHFKGMVFHPKGYKKNEMVPGRHAMTCCVEDIAFVGFKCVSDSAAMIKDRSWVEVTGVVKKEYYKEFQGDGPVIYATSVLPTDKPKEEVVLFN